MNDAEVYFKLYGKLLYVVPFYKKKFNLVEVSDEQI